MDQTRTSWGCIGIIQWIWIQVMRPFSYMAEPIQLDNNQPSSSSFFPSSSTSPPARRWKYDVFLSFRGPDTRKGITSDIRDRLRSRGIRTFMDDPDLQVGDTISPTLIAAIEASHFAVVILSQNYASSTWCLEELVKICESMINGERIFPLFYHVDPTDVRYQNNGKFKEAFSKHETSDRHEPETVKKWRAALKQVADKSGWTSDDFKTHRELVVNIVETLSSKLTPNPIESKDDFYAYEATTEAMDQVNEALRDEEMIAVGVYGMGGVGKTTMVTHVAAQACRNGTFNHWILVTISQTPNFNQIQLRLSDLLGVKLGEQTEDGRAARLHKEIMRKEKLLIILDDVWDIVELSKIGIPNFNELQNCSSKVLMTTRRSHVCYVMECQRKIILKSLSEQDSWTLFARKARRSFELPTFEGVARNVARECKGLPIALIAVARALGDKDLAEWMRASQRLAKSQTANLDDKGESFNCIKLSYDYLKDEECKSFFLLCCLFPEDSDIEIDQLFKYGRGIGLFQDAETLKEGQDRAHSLVLHLIYSSLLLESYNSDRVRLHDVVRDASIQISQSEHNFFVKAGCGLKDWPRQIHEGCTAISLMKNNISKLPENLICPKLQILLLNQNSCIKEIPETFFQNPNDLRVVDLSWTVNLALLPESFGRLTSLTFLSLFGCTKLISGTSIIGKLKKLESLYLPDLDLWELSIELGDLTNLRIFSCDSKSIKRIPPGIVSKWNNLEELHMRNFGGWGCQVEGEGEGTINASFEEVTSLPRLQVLDALISNAECLPKYVEPNPEWVEFKLIVGSPRLVVVTSSILHDCSRAIVLQHDNISCLPEWFCDGLMERTDGLHWRGCQSLRDIFQNLEHGRLRKLTCLHLEGFRDYDKSADGEAGESFMENEIKQSSEDEIGKSFTQDETRQSFREVNSIETPLLGSLNYISLYRVDCEKSMEAIQILPPGSLLNMKKLDVRECYTKGNTVIQLATLQVLSNLEELYISEAGNRYIFGQVELLVSVPLKLRNIKLHGCSIISLCNGRAPPTMFQNLQDLDIVSCNMEGSLFTHEVAQCLPQLDSLRLFCCPLLERIVEAGNNKTILPKLKDLTLVGYPLLYSESGSLDIECPSLERFELLACPKFVASFDDFNSRKQQKAHR